MPSSLVRRFSDPDDYGTSIRTVKAEVTITGRGSFSATLTRIDLHRLRMQRFSENLPRIAHSAQPADRIIITFRTQPGPSLRRGGVEMDPTKITLSGGADFYQLTSGSVCFGSMSLPTEQMIAVTAEMAGYDLRPSADPLLISPEPAAMARLLRLHGEAGGLAGKVPEIIVDCLGRGRVREDRSAVRRHQLIMRRFRQVLEAFPDSVLYLPQLCATIGVSERTLRRCCQEQIGMGPIRFLLLRRLHLARRALREADPTATTVTAIAMQYGFWELGRFAAEYRTLFNEPPSVTLHRPPEWRPRSALQLPQILAEIA
jgi:AraC-like DNA-binding protein